MREHLRAWLSFYLHDQLIKEEWACSYLQQHGKFCVSSHADGDRLVKEESLFVGMREEVLSVDAEFANG